MPGESGRAGRLCLFGIQPPVERGERGAGRDNSRKSVSVGAGTRRDVAFARSSAKARRSEQWACGGAPWRRADCANRAIGEISGFGLNPRGCTAVPAASALFFSAFCLALCSRFGRIQLANSYFFVAFVTRLLARSATTWMCAALSSGARVGDRGRAHALERRIGGSRLYGSHWPRR